MAPLQPVQPLCVSHMPSRVPGPLLASLWGGIPASLCLQSIQGPEGEVVKPLALTSALPDIGSGGGSSMKEGHPVEARALGVGKDS